MSYAAAYALGNYSMVDPKLGTDVYSNLRLIRAFEKGLDPASSEAGFVLTHVHMVSATGPLITGAIDLLEAITTARSSTNGNIGDIAQPLRTMLTAMHSIDAAMELMWAHSQPKEYLNYRTFIFGITSQSMFPSGVIYESQFTDSATGKDIPQFFRGESGANDSIIPLLDYLLEIPMPPNPLTEILKDFRNYRPQPHRVFLSYVRSKAVEVGVRNALTAPRSASNGAAAPDAASENWEVAGLYLRLLDMVRKFRWRHWLFAREYILKRSGHPTATGGSPIVTWLPNQLFAVMGLMEDVWMESGLEGYDGWGGEEGGKEGGNGRDGLRGLREMMEEVREQRGKLEKEVRKYCQERGA